MEVILTLLLCTLGLFLYLLNSSKNEVWRLRDELRDKDRLIEELRRQLYASQQTASTSPQLPVPSSERFVSVIFRQGDTKYYDYFIGNDQNISVGDFVEVYFNNKATGKVERRVAQVIYVSVPGEVSEYARSNIKRKVNRR